VAVDGTTGTGAILSRLRDDLEALDRAYSAGHHGLWSARRRADLVDAALAEVFSAAVPPGARAALAALGGYGRGALAPRSDVDLLLIHDGSAPEDVDGFASSFLYPLWDAGLSIGHAVRTPAEAEASAEERLDTLTATLDARLVAGDRDLFTRATERVLRRVRQDPADFAVRLGEAASERRQRYGSAAELLEPNLKEGGGGLRDVASLGWLATALGRSLEEDGLLGARERAALEAAEEFLTRVRSALHLETGKRTDRLVLDQQPSVARAMGFADEPRLLAEDGLMRALFEHARAVDYLTEEILIARRRPRDASGSAELGDVTEVLRSFVEPDGEPRSPTSAELESVKAIDLPGDLPWTEETREAFLAILRADGASRALGTLDRLGILGALLPAWRDVRCRPQRDPYHRSTVDVHLRSTLEGVRSILFDLSGDDRMIAEAAGQIADRDAVLLGALLHDIGKNGGGAHVPVGARLAGDALDRMRLPARTRELAHFMVEHHLLLPDTATRRDLGDDELILDVASKVGTPERLAALYLLSVADAAATGPAAATEWRRTLVRELVAKVQRVFERGEMGEEVAERLTGRVNDIRDLLVAERPEEVDRFVLRMPRGYFLTVDPARAARHFPVVAPPLGSQEVRTSTWEGARPGTYELLVAATDRPGLLSWVAGCLTLEGLSILTAQVFTTEDGTAVDLFEVQGVYEPKVREETWREFRGTLRKAIEGRTSLDHRVGDKRRHYPEPRRAIPVTVSVDNDASDFFTVIEVGAADRIGLLYDVTRTLAELELDVHLAKIATFADRVIDAFYVRDGQGRKIEEPGPIAEIEATLRERLTNEPD
jgi:[protein-PII] uridylyltransferase